MYPILYSFRRCPFAMRARLAISYANTRVEIREVLLKDKPIQLLEISAKATVPVLQLESAAVVDESLDIMRWALGQQDLDHWLDGIEQQQPLIEYCDVSFKYWLDKYKYADRHPEYTMLYYREQCGEFLAELESRLQKTDYLCADKMRLADAAIFPFIRQFAHVDKNWFFQTDYCHLQKWLHGQLDSALFQSIMIKQRAWSVEHEQVLFPQ
ncbi:MAG: glutathione S-transferase [Osedax symbiont Rs1]|nr:MAG: glutathione S-transferase [Osedax symbiont Rs1]